jgi:GT2 family glycosyltransferase
LNNDTFVDKNLVDKMLASAENENVGLIVPKIYFAPGFEFHKKRYKESDLGHVIWYAGGKMDWGNLIGQNVGVDEVDHGQFGIKMETELATGCCFMVKTEVLNRIGFFDERYFLYYEDADFSERVKNAGYKIIFEPQAYLWHKNAGSSGGSGSELQDYYISRNRLIFGMKYAPTRTKIALFRESLKLLTAGRKWQRRGVMDFYIKNFGKGSFRV